MNYKKHYNLLIGRAKARSISGYIERHHVIPKCMSGSDNKCNIVELTPEEHYVAHQLLAKIYPNHTGLSFAALTMSQSTKYVKRNNKQYGWLRKRHSINVSKAQTGKIYYNDGTRSIRISRDEIPPEGFVKGRHYSPTKGKKVGKRSDNFSRKEIQDELRKRRWEKDRKILCEKFGLNSIEEVKALLISIKSEQHPRYWINPILKLYPFLGKARLRKLVE